MIIKIRSTAVTLEIIHDNGNNSTTTDAATTTTKNYNYVT